MKHTLFFLICMSFMAFLFTVVGILAYFGYGDAGVIFWSRPAIKSPTGKVAWIIGSAICFVIFSTLAVRRYRRKQ